ncbi:hypothetical protein GR927_15720 [Mycolicibacterium sp. 3033]|nr:hypothetical protein [Mycolicibacterium aurantiacum]
MARYGSGDDGNYYSDDDDATQLSNYGQGGYPDDYQAGPDQPTPWYRKPAALVAFGALGAVIVALIIYGLAKAITGDAPSEPTTTSLTPLTSTAPAVAPSSTVDETTATTTESTAPTTTTTTPTTTETTSPTTTTTPSTSVSTSTSTSTVTQTETETQTVTQSSAPPPAP